MRDSAASERLAVYIHWPFCRSKCPYCDFNSHVRDGVDATRWTRALLADLDHQADLLPDREVGSVFFGGGTPSLMPPETVAALVDRLRRRWRVAAGMIGLAVGAAVCLAPLAMSETAGARYVVGAKDFTESYILADVMAGRIRRTGAAVQIKSDLGSAFAYDALRDGAVDTYVDYSGTLWADVLHRTDNPGRAAVMTQLTRILKRRDGVLVLGSLGFEDAYALAMRKEQAERLGIRSIADLAA
ncbi:MAG: glycine betaine ABC transporter substrate-binding protein, partial [Stellaceae bacterium]